MHFEDPDPSAAMPTPLPSFEDDDAREEVIGSFEAKELTDDPELDRIAKFAARLCGAKVALVNLVGCEVQSILAREGVDLDETPTVPSSFCVYTMRENHRLTVLDASKDPRFADNEFVTGGPKFRFYAGHALVSKEGAPLGALCVLDPAPREEGLDDFQEEGLAVLAQAAIRRLEARRENLDAERTIAEREQRLESIIDSVPGIAWSADEAANFDYFNARWQEVTGAPPPKVASEWRGVVHPDDFDASMERFVDAVSNHHAFEDQWRMRHADGSYRWVLSRAVPMGTKGAARWFGTVIDIDEQHRQSEARELLAGELSHRIKNIFAVVSGLVAIKSRNHPEAAEFAEDLSSTIKALGLAHDYVRPVEGRRGESLRDLLRDLMAPYQNADESRITVDGADSAIGHRAATPLALIFHELATNSAKYGALSCDEGTITIDIADTGDDLAIRWQEFSDECDDVADETREGFGSRLLRLAVEGQLSGRFERTFSSDGLVSVITLPKKALTT